MAYLHPDKVAAVSAALKKPKKKRPVKKAPPVEDHPGLLAKLAQEFHNTPENHGIQG